MEFALIPPIAHRGLHDKGRGVIENTATAFEAAIRGRYAIETDIQAAKDGEPVIFHDWRLERLTEGTGEVRAYSPPALKRMAMRGTGDRILSLAEFLELIDGRATLFLEIKSAGNTGRQLERRIAEDLTRYRGRACVMGFDPGSLRAMRRLAPQIPRGLSAYRFDRRPKMPLTAAQTYRLTHMIDANGIDPAFVTYDINDLPTMSAWIRRRFPRAPLITWTVRTLEDRRKAAIYADGIIFEGFMPATPSGRP
ncbi:MAG: glycerophosphodiester phosphodiesterase [Hyphomicrobiales bacterium]|nr:glycerophosphodiester phosphodiesterase [Hyphomicrobiales bacterium]